MRLLEGPYVTVAAVPSGPNPEPDMVTRVPPLVPKFVSPLNPDTTGAEYRWEVAKEALACPPIVSTKARAVPMPAVLLQTTTECGDVT